MFKLNGKEYNDIELSFNAVCKLEKRGFDITKLADGSNSLSFIRAIISLALNDNEELAGIEIEEHLKNGGSVEEIGEIVTKSVQDSGFFQALAKTKN